MYLSRVEVDMKNRAKIKDLTHLGAYHNWVEQSFPEDLNNEKSARHLWRIDDLAGKRYLLILSESKPGTELNRYGVAGTVQTKSYDQFLARLQEGQQLRFRLTANPSHTVSKPGSKQGRIYPHITIEQQRKWLTDRAEKAGFQLVEQTNPTAEGTPLAFDIVNRDWAMLQRRPSRGGRGVRLSRVTFEGVLRISDLTSFKRTLIEGLGREKAFGMGLMTVIPEG